MAGAVDLFSSSQSLTGTNLYEVDKSPLAEIDQGGVSSIIGQQAGGLGGSIIDILTSLVESIFGGLLGGSGSIFTDVETFFGNILQMLGNINPLSPTFDPFAAIADFITIMLSPTQWFVDLLAILGNPLGIGTGSITLATFENIPLLGPIVSIVESIINTIEHAFAGVPLVGPLIQPIFDFVNGILGLNSNAQGSADTANVGLAILNARVNDVITGGASLYDTFNRNSTDLGPDYAWVYSTGAGTMGTNPANSGTTVWASVGFSTSAIHALHMTTPMATVRMRMSMVLDVFTYGYAGVQSHAELIGRSDSTLSNFVVATFGGLDVTATAYCSVGFVVAGAYTQLGPLVPFSPGNGDLWDFEVGTAADPYQFRLLQNNSVRVDVTDSGHASRIDAIPGTTYKYVGFAEDAAVGAGPFGTTYQQAPPNIQVFAAADF